LFNLAEQLSPELEITNLLTDVKGTEDTPITTEKNSQEKQEEASQGIICTLLHSHKHEFRLRMCSSLTNLLTNHK